MPDTNVTEASSTSSPIAGTPNSTNSTSKEIARAGGRSADLVTDQGKTTIADAVVAKVAGIAASEVNGVHALGGGAARVVGALRERIPGGTTNHSQGVSVEVGERQAAIDIELIAEYGVSIAELARGIRRNVIGAVEGMTGLEVTEVNIDVQDVHVPSDDDSQGESSKEQSSEPRVQ